MSAPWMKAVLIPFWVLQIVFILLAIGDGAYMLSHLAQGVLIYYEDDFGDVYTETGKVPDLWMAFYALTVVVAFISLAFVITEIVLFAKGRLSALVFFIFQTIDVILWTVVFGLAIYGIAVAGYDSIAIIVACVAAWVLFIGTFIYACVMFHRHHVNGSGNHNSGYSTRNIDAVAEVKDSELRP